MNSELSNGLVRMDRKALLLGRALAAGLLATALLLVALHYGRATAEPTAADDSVEVLEMDLKGSGQAWDLNPDHKGHLWISDYLAGEIWHLNPATNVYTTYGNIDYATDARLDGNGNLWWSNYDDYQFGRIELDNNVRTTWPLTGTGLAGGLNFDDQGRVWLTDANGPHLFRFDPDAKELCDYGFPDEGASHYVLAHDGNLWLADWKKERIVRVDPADDTYWIWDYNLASDPRGMAFDAQGNLWWGSYDQRSALFRLTPSTNYLIYYTYTLPGGGKGRPAMVDASHGLIWYSDETGSFGRLNPNIAAYKWQPVSTDGDKLDGTCYSEWQPLSESPVNTTKQEAEWSPAIYTSTGGADGWLSVQLPAGPGPRGAWGIRAVGDGIYVINQDRQKLVYLDMPWHEVYLPMVVGD